MQLPRPQPAARPLGEDPAAGSPAAGSGGAGLWAAWLFLAVAVFPVPNTIALRNLLFVLGLGGLILGRYGRLGGLPAATWRGDWLRAPAVLLGVLTAWIALQAVLVSPQPWVSFDNMRGDWLVPILWGALGWAAARRIPAAPLRAAAFALAAPVAIVILYQVWQLATTGALRPAYVPYAERDFFSLVNGLLAALLIGDRLAVALAGTSSLGLAARAGWGLALVSLVADPLIRTRNGTIVTLTLVAAALLLAFGAGKSRRWPKAVLAAIVAALVLLGYGSMRNDERWQLMAESVAIGLRSDNLSWLRPEVEMPRTASGQLVDHSAFMRVVWARRALEGIAAHPLGLGFGRDAFGRAVAERYGATGLVSSHSGWLDFTLATGLPGLALLLAAAAALGRSAWRRFRDDGQGAALPVLFVLAAFLLRTLLDGHLSGWYLSLFGLLIGAAIAAAGQARCR